MLILITLSIIEESARKSGIEPRSFGIILAIIYMGVYTALYSFIAISIHRIVLLGSNSVPTWGIKRWTNREHSFFTYAIGFAVITLFFIAFSSITGHWVGLLVALIIVCIFTARLSLVFPACATDQKISLKESWRLTKGKTIFMVLVMYFWPLLALLPVYLVMLLIESIGGGGLAASQVIYDIFGSVLFVIGIACLSLAYLRIMGNDEI